MKNRWMALAISAAVAAPDAAFAQAANPVTIYGTLSVGFERVEADGGAAPPISARNRVTSNAASHLGFRGTEDIGGGLKAFFQVESAINLDAGTTNLASRNSGVGLTGTSWGTILLGQWDTPYKTATVRLDPNYTTIAAYTGIAHGNGGGTSPNVAARFGFDRRQQNTMQYWTPNWGGFTARVAYGANEEKTAVVNPYMTSLSVVWQKAAYYVGAAVEQHHDYGMAGSKDRASQVFGQAKFGAFTLGLMAERLKYAGFGPASTASYKGAVLASSAGGGLEVSDWFASAAWQFGASALSLGYGRDAKVKLNGRDDASRKSKQTSLRYTYDFSKRTQFYAIATKLDNGNNAVNNFGFQNIGNVVGQDPKGVGAGLIHRF